MRLEGICSIAKPMHGCPALLSISIRSSPNARNSKNLHRPLTESDLELDDIFTWQGTA
jgi:hypothetical protein